MLADVGACRIRPGLRVEDLLWDFNLALSLSDILVGVPDFEQVGKQTHRALRIRQPFLVTSFEKEVTPALEVRHDSYHCLGSKEPHNILSLDGEPS